MSSSRINNCSASPRRGPDEVASDSRWDGRPLLLECLEHPPHVCRGLQPASNTFVQLLPNVLDWVSSSCRSPVDHTVSPVSKTVCCPLQFQLWAVQLDLQWGLHCPYGLPETAVAGTRLEDVLCPLGLNVGTWKARDEFGRCWWSGTVWCGVLHGAWR